MHGHIMYTLLGFVNPRSVNEETQRHVRDFVYKTRVGKNALDILYI